MMSGFEEALVGEADIQEVECPSWADERNGNAYVVQLTSDQTRAMDFIMGEGADADANLQHVLDLMDNPNLRRLSIALQENEALLNLGLELIPLELDNYSYEDIEHITKKVVYPRQLYDLANYDNQGPEYALPPSIPAGGAPVTTPRTTILGRSWPYTRLTDRNLSYRQGDSIYMICREIKNLFEEIPAAEPMSGWDDDKIAEADLSADEPADDQANPPTELDVLWSVVQPYAESHDDADANHHYAPMTYLNRNVLEDVAPHNPQGAKGIGLYVLETLQFAKDNPGVGLRFGSCRHIRTKDRLAEISLFGGGHHLAVNSAWVGAMVVPHNGRIDNGGGGDGNSNGGGDANDGAPTCTVEECRRAAILTEGLGKNLAQILKISINKEPPSFTGAFGVINRDRDGEEDVQAADFATEEEAIAQVAGSRLGSVFESPNYSVYCTPSRQSREGFIKQSMIGVGIRSTSNRIFDFQAAELEEALAELAEGEDRAISNLPENAENKKHVAFAKFQKKKWQAGELPQRKKLKMDEIDPTFMGDGTPWRSPEQVWRDRMSSLVDHMEDESNPGGVDTAADSLLRLDAVGNDDLKHWARQKLYQTGIKTIDPDELSELTAKVVHWAEMAELDRNHSRRELRYVPAHLTQQVCPRPCLCKEKHLINTRPKPFSVVCSNPTCGRFYYVLPDCMVLGRVPGLVPGRMTMRQYESLPQQSRQWFCCDGCLPANNISNQVPGEESQGAAGDAVQM